MAAPSLEFITEALSSLHPELYLTKEDDLSGRDPGEHAQNFGAGILAAPASRDAAKALIEWAAANNVAIVPHGGRTSLAGGCVSERGQVILSSQRLNKIIAINVDEQTAVVEAGVTLQALQEAASEHGLTTGIDLPSRGTATIGGLVNTNAGGLLAFRNGVMRHQVLGLEAILPDGSIFSDLTRVVKVSAGPDIKQMLIGAEGALGFTTSVCVKLEPIRSARATAMLAVADAKTALAIAAHLKAQAGLTLEACELMWEDYIRDHAKLRSFELSFIPEGSQALILEVSAASEEAAIAGLEEALAEIWEELGILDGVVAQSMTQAKTMWVLREESSFYYALYNNPPSYDVSLPPATLDPYVEGLRSRLYAIDERYHAYVYGHIADGNLHITVKMDYPSDKAILQRIEDAIYQGVRASGGSFSAEHGVGFEKRYGYENHVDPVKKQLSLALKKLIDPQNLFNPGKVPFA
jgi:FAD/FMN-containing dehydrogenase